MLRSLTSFFFFLTENYSTFINRPVRGPRMTRKSALKVVTILVVRLYGIRAG